MIPTTQKERMTRTWGQMEIREGGKGGSWGGGAEVQPGSLRTPKSPGDSYIIMCLVSESMAR